MKKHERRAWVATAAMAVMMTALGAGTASAQTALIGGEIWTGALELDGSPKYVGNDPIYDAQVMVQTMHAGGKFVTYGDLRLNTWQAIVPPGEYIVMFSAPGHDCTSREFEVRAGMVKLKDAYLPPLPLPTANLLVYAFVDNKTNGEDDFPADPGLRGVTFNVHDEDGVLLAQGVSGSEPENLPAGVAVDPNGLFYFTGLPPGEVVVTADTSTAPVLPGADGWYNVTTEEGGHAWDPKLYPGDPGTEDGGYLLWFGLVPKLGQLPPGADATGRIFGQLLDADGNDPEEPFPYGETTLVTPNIEVPDGLVILVTMDETVGIHPVATAEPDPVTGRFAFENVPPGDYKIINTDLPLDYVWTQTELSVVADVTTEVAPLMPRFFARMRGYVLEKETGLVMPGVPVRVRLKDGGVWKETVTDADGWYNFDNLAEVEVMGYVDAELPPGYRGARRAGDTYGLSTKYVQWYTLNYRADLELEAIPPTGGDIAGFVFNDNLEVGTWVGDGVFDPHEERTFHDTVARLYNGAGDLLREAVVGSFDKAATLAQGWSEPYTYPPDEIGGVYHGALPGYYEFLDLSPGWYRVEVRAPAGYVASPAGSSMTAVQVSGGVRHNVDFGFRTLVPQAGEIEGGVFDDIYVDFNQRSLLYMEKAGLPGVPVGCYDHLGYLLGVGFMGNPLCFAGSSACPPGEDPIQKPEMERRFAPGVHIYLGNDPTQPGYDPNYMPMALNYMFPQGGFKFEADWSLIPFGMGAHQGWIDGQVDRIGDLREKLRAERRVEAEAGVARVAAEAMGQSTKAEKSARKKALSKAKKAAKKAAKRIAKLQKQIDKTREQIAARRARG